MPRWKACSEVQGFGVRTGVPGARACMCFHVCSARAFVSVCAVPVCVSVCAVPLCVFLCVQCPCVCFCVCTTRACFSVCSARVCLSVCAMTVCVFLRVQCVMLKGRLYFSGLRLRLSSTTKLRTVPGFNRPRGGSHDANGCAMSSRDTWQFKSLNPFG